MRQQAVHVLVEPDQEALGVLGPVALPDHFFGETHADDDLRNEQAMLERRKGLEIRLHPFPQKLVFDPTADATSIVGVKAVERVLELLVLHFALLAGVGLFPAMNSLYETEFPVGPQDRMKLPRLR